MWGNEQTLTKWSIWSISYRLLTLWFHDLDWKQSTRRLKKTYNISWLYLYTFRYSSFSAVLIQDHTWAPSLCSSTLHNVKHFSHGDFFVRKKFYQSVLSIIFLMVRYGESVFSLHSNWNFFFSNYLKIGEKF